MRKFIILILAFSVGFTPFYFARAQEAVDDTLDVLDIKEELRQELSELQADIQILNNEISQKQSDERSLGREISILNNQIKKTELELQQTALAIRQTEFIIEENNLKIIELEGKIEKTKSVIAEIMRSIYEEDTRSVVELIVSSEDLSDFLDYSRFLNNLQSSLQKALDNIKVAKLNIEEEQISLEEEQESQYRLRTLQGAQKGGLDANKREKNNLLNLTQAQKKDFERIVVQKTKTVEEIRNQLFRLEGADVALSFSEAYEYASSAFNLTGVRPAFLLAMLKRESSWGENTGLCILVNPETGVGRGVNTGNLYERVMKPSRDVQPFLQITQELGRDPYNTRVSCPHRYYGYGGAMGPAQFIPSTWMAYKDDVTALLGHTADPWNIRDAFVASAVKLARGGATNQTYATERKAALLYYAGGGWSNPAFWPYTDDPRDGVMVLASRYQKDIDILEGR